ncbi:MAG TPA: PQQ-dependent sugar dehydrogenase [Pirellulales bacterium]|nr:PQQ-dependent sugar dehydrogenase [Pirellulales bacterium]
MSPLLLPFVASRARVAATAPISSVRITALAATILVAATTAQAQTVIRVASGLDNPLFATFAPGDTSREFIVEQGSNGTADIKILNLADNTINPTPFLTLSGIATGGEQGLLGLAFDPNYATNGRFYVDYTAPGGAFNAGVTHITRYQVSSNANVANAASATDVLTIDQPQTNHNGGWIGFSNRPGDSGNLYIAMGDGGNANDQGTGHIEPTGNAQDTNSLLGKMLRINVDTPGPAQHPNYSIPSNNPFANGVGGAPEVFLYGLRNPFRDSFDTATGNLMIGDVGQGAREEIDVQKATNPGGGENYSWRLREGTIATPGVGGPAPPGAVNPILDYPHTPTAQEPIGGQAVIGGYIYHGAGVPSLDGKYIFGDLLGPISSSNPNDLGRIFSLDYNGTTASNFTDITSQLFAGTSLSLSSPHSFGVDGFGEMYIVDGNGSLYRIVQSAAAGDANHDAIVNSQDIALISASWLATGSNLPGDTNHDGIVNSQDIALVSSNWLAVSGEGGAAAVPEPTGLELALIALVGCALTAFQCQGRFS